MGVGEGSAYDAPRPAGDGARAEGTLPGRGAGQGGDGARAEDTLPGRGAGQGGDGARAEGTLPGRGAARLVIVLGLLSAFGPLCLDMYLPALTELAPALGSTDTGAQLTLSACILGLALGQVIAGPLSDRIGRRAPLLAGVALFSVVSAACAVTTSMPLLIALRFVQGLGGAAGIVVGRAVVADRYTGKAAAAYFAAMAAVNGFAPILSPIIGGQLLRVGTWRTVFWVLAGVGVLLLVATYIVIGESLPRGRRSDAGLAATARGFAMVLRDRVYLGYTLAGCFVTAAMFGYISGSPFMIQGGFGLTPQQFSIIFAANGAGLILVTWLGARLLRWFDSIALLGAGLTIAGAGAIVLSVAVIAQAGLWPVLIGFFLIVASVGLALTYSSALAMERRRDVAGAASAVLGLAQWILAAVAAPLVGIGDRAAGMAVAVTALIAVILAAIAFTVARIAARAEVDSRRDA